MQTVDHDSFWSDGNVDMAQGYEESGEIRVTASANCLRHFSVHFDVCREELYE